ncbi:MAG: hypothetical protein HUU29_10470 [Planctomycetaceae bacterium]|nr:hypothetical protein [Planctomycetaceae bacterium]
MAKRGKHRIQKKLSDLSESGPVCTSFILCDRAVFNGKWNLIGIFDLLTVSRGEKVEATFDAYCRIESASQGQYFRAELLPLDKDATRGDVLWASETMATRSQFELAFHVKNVILSIGQYALVLFEIRKDNGTEAIRAFHFARFSVSKSTESKG